MSVASLVERFEDMSPRGRLRIMQQEDGDIIVAVVPDPDKQLEYSPSVEFCSCMAGGGKSPRTRVALLALMKAMAEDNKEEGSHRRGEIGMNGSEGVESSL